MALRVLLADESTTIKKVMQLALQDFAVEVKAVHAGIDVVDVARSFQPDLIFADVLLQKKNGYEVCALIKNDADLKHIPVVLMWSSFMDLDDAQARSCGAEARLEKPFDVETLRKEVLELVPKTRSQRLAHFLDYSPKLNEELKQDPAAKTPTVQPAAPPPAAPATQPPPQKAPSAGSTMAPRSAPPPPPKAAQPAAPTSTPSPTQAAAPVSGAAKTPPPPPATAAPTAPPATPPPKSSWTMESFDDPSSMMDDVTADEEESFQPLELTHLTGSGTQDAQEPASLDLTTDEASADDESWARQDLSKFKLDLPPISVGEGSDEFKIDMGEEEFTSPDFEVEPAHIDTNPRHPKADRSGESARAQEPARASMHEHDDVPVEFGNDLTLEPHQINEAEHEIALPLEPLSEGEEPLELSLAQPSSAKVPRGADQMSAEHLEKIIRAQSREIIEQVVRKLVPDLAATIIREELERLLEDTAVREASSSAGSSGSGRGRKDNRV